MSKINRKIKIALFNAKEYDISSFDKAIKAFNESDISNDSIHKQILDGKNQETINNNLETIQFEIKYFATKLNSDTAKLANGYDVACAFVNDDIDAETICKLKECGVEILAMRCAGYNNVDIEHAYKKLHIVRVPAYSPYAIAEHAMGMLLTIIRRIHKAYIRTRDFNFSLAGLKGFELHNKTVGIIGTGKIGSIFADICTGFGMKVLGYDKLPKKDSNIEYVELDELFKKSDVISLHCPLTKDNHHMINLSTIDKMKKEVVIINTSRGGLIDAKALIEGIKNKKIGAACLDVYEEESDVFYHDFSSHIVADDVLARLISMPNVLITSHQAYLTDEALKNIAETTLSNIVDIKETGKCINEVCYKCEKFDKCNRDHSHKCF